MKKRLRLEENSHRQNAFTSLPIFFSMLLSCLSAQSLQPSDYVSRMAREHTADEPVATAIALRLAQDSVTAEPISYGVVEGSEINGYLAQPATDDVKLAGIMVIHEWWGLNDNIRAVTRQLGARGYNALAVDLYGGSVAKKPSEAVELMRGVQADEGKARDNLKQAYRYLSEELDCPRVGVIGWCFGGGWSLQTALLLPDEIDAAVIYYGRLVTDPAILKPLSMPILGIFGAEDRGIPLQSVRDFEEALKSPGKETHIEIYVYDGVGHAFANPSGRNYNAEAAEDAWEKTVSFLKKHLRANQ